MIPAVFDVDRTLINGMSGSFFVRYLWEHTVYGIMAKLRIMKALYLWKMNSLSEADIVRMGATSYRGLRADDLTQWGEKCFTEVIKPTIFADAFHEVQQHLRQGHHVIFATGSSNYIAEPIGRFFGAHKTIGTQARIRFGVSTGQIENHICYGEGKLRLFEGYLKTRGMDLSNAYVYTDGHFDLPLLDRAKHPVAVNPYPELEDIAVERGWPIYRWQDLKKEK